MNTLGKVRWKNVKLILEICKEQQSELEKREEDGGEEEEKDSERQRELYRDRASRIARNVAFLCLI